MGYKAAEKLLDIAGYNVPRVEQQRDNREGLKQFMDELRARSASKPPQVTVNIQQNISDDESLETVIESEEASASVIPPPYSSQVLPGGKLPNDFLAAIDHHERGRARPEELFTSETRDGDGDDDPYS